MNQRERRRRKRDRERKRVNGEGAAGRAVVWHEQLDCHERDFGSGYWETTTTTTELNNKKPSSK